MDRNRSSHVELSEVDLQFTNTLFIVRIYLDEEEEEISNIIHTEHRRLHKRLA